MPKHSLIFLVLLLAFSNSFSQKIDSLLDIQRNADAQEKVYVQFDKSYYNAGETIWFKAYLFTGIDPSVTSKTFYAELVDEQANVLVQKTAPIAFSGAAGHFEIDSVFAKRLVFFRGYTLSTLNSDTTFIYTKPIRILSQKTAAAKGKQTALPPTVSFLPEGGDWVAGLSATMAFAATNQQGQPITVSGIVTDDKGLTVADLKTWHDGMGRFSLAPEEGKIYTAKWKTDDGKTYTTPLPSFKTQGIIFKIGDEGGNKRFTVYRTAQAAASVKRLYIAGYMNQHLVFEATINLMEKVAATGLFPVQNLPSGLLQITVFDDEYKPVAERITFVNNHDYEFDGDIFFNQKSVAPRGLNQVQLTISDTVPANLSVAITDAVLNASPGMEDNIITRLLLTGELRGNIHNPYYYFFSNADSAALHLDLVMLTHGWRRYNWPAVLAGKTRTPVYKETDYLALSGQISGLPTGSFGSDLQLTGILQTSDSAKNVLVLPVNRQGKVFTEGLVFYDKAKLFFNFNKKTLSFDKSMLLVDNGLRKMYTKAMLDTTVAAGLTEPDTITMANNIRQAKLSLQNSRLAANSSMLENITVSAKVKTPKEKMEEKYVSGLFSGDGNGFDLVNDPAALGYMDIFQYLQGRVAGLQISTGGSGPTLTWRGGTPALYLNEMQADASLISGTPVSDIAYIKILRPGASVVSGGGNGVIAIYTRRGGDAQPNPNAKGLSFVQMNGYSALKQFYSPNYATVSERDAYKDLRTTLYWNPLVYVDKSRRQVRFTFYNNDVTKRFRVVMEGLNADGKLIHIEKEIGN